MDRLVDLQRARIAFLEERVRQLEEALMPASITVPLEYGLTAMEARVFAHLASREFSTHRSLMTAMYDYRSGEANGGNVKALVCHMRRKLSRFGIRIESVRGEGYRLVREPEVAA